MSERYAQDPGGLLDYLKTAFRFSAIRLDELRACSPLFERLPYVEAARKRCALVRSPDGVILAALDNPYDSALQDWLEEHVRDAFQYRIAHPAELSAWLAEQEQSFRAMEGIPASAGEQAISRDEAEDISLEAISLSDSPVIKLVASTLYDALKAGASDIHLETRNAGLVVKYRIDGVLAPAKTVEGTTLADQILSRVKVMAQLDIAERRVPQDGRFQVRSRGRHIDLRVSIMPSLFGEDAVLRILDKHSLSAELKGLTLEQLGFGGRIASSLRGLSREPHGMLLVTGPTGSGKTTSLYALISEVNNGLDKFVTIEDPVEYQLPGVLQIPVNEKKGLTFARGLRSILRHDPDRIMVGEIRDPETAEIALQSALTGHLVYTTVHANSVFDVIGRFTHMGVDTFNLASALNAVMAQRLVRLICTTCSGRGCASCTGTGFRGRKAIAELMILDDELRELIGKRVPTRRLKDAARAKGTGMLREAALELVQNGETTLEEADRVTFAAR